MTNGADQARPSFLLHFEIQSNAWFMQRALEVNEPISFVQEHAREGDGCGGYCRKRKFDSSLLIIRE